MEAIRISISGEDSVFRAAGGAWRRWLLTWSITSFPMHPCANGFSHCQFHCGLYFRCPSASDLTRIAGYFPHHFNFSDQADRIDAA